MESVLRFAIITVSDSAFKKEKQDLSGPKLCDEVKVAFPTCNAVIFAIVQDDVAAIKDALIAACFKYDVILTTGGTGFAPRDVTPEATREVIQKEAPGLAYAMISKSLLVTDMAMLSRAVCGIRGQTIIVNLPGSPKGAVECFGFIKGTLSHAVALLKEDAALVKQVHCQHDHREDLIEPSKVSVNVVTRQRTSPYPMLEVKEAFSKVIAELVPTLETDRIPIRDALNRILAEDVTARDHIPAYPTSTKDGYAVRSADGKMNRTVLDVIAAGDTPFNLEFGEGKAIRINTGASVPPGADTVVRVEDTGLMEVVTHGYVTEEKIITVNVVPAPGANIRKVGSDVTAHTTVLTRFDRLSGAHLGVLRSLGVEEVLVYRRTPVGILSTGNEVMEGNHPLKPGEIFDSNKITLINMLRHYGYSANDCGIARDNADILKKALHNAFCANDVVITTGGVSMGEFDILKEVLVQDFNATIHFGRINMKPGKPTTFATLRFKNRVKMVFGLPGNPASAGVTCLLFVIPTLKYLERSTNYKFPEVKVAFGESYRNTDTRLEYARGIVKAHDGRLSAFLTGSQVSSRLNSMVNANALILLPTKDLDLKPYTEVTALLVDQLL